MKIIRKEERLLIYTCEISKQHATGLKHSRAGLQTNIHAGLRPALKCFSGICFNNE
jgi:hypothetical protein